MEDFCLNEDDFGAAEKVSHSEPGESVSVVRFTNKENDDKKSPHSCNAR